MLEDEAPNPSLLRPILATLAEGRPLDEAQAREAFAVLLSGKATQAQIGAMLMGLRVRGETVEEISAATLVMRKQMLPVTIPPGAMDVVGTGGDGLGTLNISTAASLVVAGAGAKVAKHGNRGVSSRSGAADILAAMGLNLAARPAAIARSIEEAGFGFMFAPNHQRATRFVMSARAELGVRTLFNLLGPLCNPAGTRRALLGVYSPEWLAPIAETMGRLGAERVWVIHGHGGADELTLTGPASIVEWVDNVGMRHFTLDATEAGLARGPLPVGGTPEENARALRALLDGEPGPYRDTVLLNAAAALVIAGRAADLIEGVRFARAAIDEGRAAHALERAIEISVQDLQQAGEAGEAGA